MQQDKIIPLPMSSDPTHIPEPMEDDEAIAAEAVAAQAKSLRWFSLSHSYTAFTATLLLMASTILSRVIGLVREAYIARLFGASGQVDAYRAAFQLPDMMSYFLTGGVVSITFVSILARYREQGREHEGEDALASIITMMCVVLTIGIVLAEIFSRSYVAHFFSGFPPEKIALTTHMTRILLPAQLFFFVGGTLGSVLIVRKQFAYQAIAPLVYNLGIIFGGLLFNRRFGVSGLALGALGGAICGHFLLNLIGVSRINFKLRFSLAWNHPGLREWVRLSLPLMLGVSLVTFDVWIMNYFASHTDGQIAHLNYAKALFTAPTAVLAMAAGAAFMPFFAALIGQGKHKEFAATVNSTVTRIIALSLLGSAWMIGLAQPLVNVVFRRGALHQADAILISTYFSVFALALFCWAAQSIYARAFYAAGNTLTPTIANTIIVILSLPVYATLYRTHGAVGLAFASDIGILTQMLTMAVLLDRTKLVPLSGLGWFELARCLVAAMLSFFALATLRQSSPLHGGLVANLGYIFVGTLIWGTICGILLTILGSQLPQMVFNRFLKRKKESNPEIVF
jgi:putative peptidoglycan lipid II flippase